MSSLNNMPSSSPINSSSLSTFKEETEDDDEVELFVPSGSSCDWLENFLYCPICMQEFDTDFSLIQNGSKNNKNHNNNNKQSWSLQRVIYRVVSSVAATLSLSSSSHRNRPQHHLPISCHACQAVLCFSCVRQLPKIPRDTSTSNTQHRQRSNRHLQQHQAGTFLWMMGLEEQLSSSASAASASRPRLELQGGIKCPLCLAVDGFDDDSSSSSSSRCFVDLNYNRAFASLLDQAQKMETHYSKQLRLITTKLQKKQKKTQTTVAFLDNDDKSHQRSRRNKYELSDDNAESEMNCNNRNNINIGAVMKHNSISNTDCECCDGCSCCCCSCCHSFSSPAKQQQQQAIDMETQQHQQRQMRRQRRDHRQELQTISDNLNDLLQTVERKASGGLLSSSVSIRDVVEASATSSSSLWASSSDQHLMVVVETLSALSMAQDHVQRLLQLLEQQESLDELMQQQQLQHSGESTPAAMPDLCNCSRCCGDIKDLYSSTRTSTRTSAFDNNSSINRDTNKDDSDLFGSTLVAPPADRSSSDTTMAAATVAATLCNNRLQSSCQHCHHNHHQQCQHHCQHLPTLRSTEVPQRWDFHGGGRHRPHPSSSAPLASSSSSSNSAIAAKFTNSLEFMLVQLQGLLLVLVVLGTIGIVMSSSSSTSFRSGGDGWKGWMYWIVFHGISSFACCILLSMWFRMDDACQLIKQIRQKQEQ